MNDDHVWLCFISYSYDCVHHALMKKSNGDIGV